MPSLAEYRRNLAAESGPYVGPEVYNVRATSGSSTTQLVCSNYPIKSGIAQNDLLLDRPLFRPGAQLEQDRNRYVMSYDPPTGTITPDLDWAFAPITTAGATTYEELEAFTYFDFEDLLLTYENLEGTGIDGIGERFEILGPWDAPTMQQLINDGLKQCWLVVDVPCNAAPGVTRHDLRLVTPWLQDPNHIRQVGMLTADENVADVDPFQRMVYGSVERDGATYILNTGSRTFNEGDVIYLRCYKRAFDHCRAAGGTFGDQFGLFLETDEGPVERDWLVSAALTVGWRRFGHILEPLANQRLVRDAAAASAWFSDRTRQHFTAVQPSLKIRRARHFGPAFR
jgi:hypothetical protein